MRKSSAVLLVLVGFSQWSCGDDPAGPGLGPDTDWQIACVKGNSDCGSLNADAHGPVEGADPDVKNDDEKIKVSCSVDSGGYSITLEDPGRPLPDPKNPTLIKARSRSVLQITKASGDGNKCFVSITEYPRTGATRIVLTETCTNTDLAGQPGNCEFSGSKNSNGYAFEGELQCPGMHQGDSAAAYAKLGAAGATDSPIKLQIQHCN